MTKSGNGAIRGMALVVALTISALPCFVFAQAGAEDSASPLQVACAPARPVVHPGESVPVQVWVGGAAMLQAGPAPSITWRTNSGKITVAQAAEWTLPGDSIVPGNVLTYRAVAIVRQGEVIAECSLQVYAIATQLGTDDRSSIGGRGLLVGHAAEPKGYGFVSYLLLRRPAQTEFERKRHLSAVAAVLSGMSAIESLLQIPNVEPSNLYLVLLPVKRRIDLRDALTSANLAQAAERVLEAYNYDRAQVVLSSTAADGTRSGPYLAILKPWAADAQKLPPWDMSHVDQSLVRDWVNAYCALAAQPRNWNDVAVAKLSLNTRNAIAVAARNLPDLVANLDRWMPMARAK